MEAMKPKDGVQDVQGHNQEHHTATSQGRVNNR